MTRWCRILLAALVIVFSASTVSEAELDAAKVLVGKWAGMSRRPAGRIPGCS